ncbi:MAG: serine protease [Bacteroidota bacterium]|nr:MAG: serine protease [Bacteroidota bacterium]HNR74711.1 Do family serine endopeptidase [Cyclobacteriaceae bacterium]
MKRFGSLLLAAVLGSVITIVATQSFVKQQAQGVKIEHVTGLPVSQVAYTTNEKGEVVPLDFTGTAEKVTQAVVHIRSTQEVSSGNNSQIPDAFRQFFFDSPFENQMPRQSTGSGVIINKDGYIVTNNHVVEGSEIVQVTLSDNRELKAEVIGTDPDTDLAVIKVNASDLPYLSFVNSDQTKVGQWVLAVGNPFNLNSTVTAGIISAKGRNINIINSNRQNRNGNQNVSTAIESFIQTDAAINPGNSGGALVDLNGGLVGINTAIASPTGSYSGYGFAVPANIVSKITEDLIAYGMVQRGWLGIQVSSVTNTLVKENNLAVNEGAYVAGFGASADKSAAKSAGIKEGDVIVKLDETEIKSNTALIEYIGRKRPGDKVRVTVNRNGKELVLPVTLKNSEGTTGTVKREEKADVAALGLELEDLDSKVLKRLDITSGVKVKELDAKLKRSGMREGFIITHVDDKAVKSVKEVNEILKKKKTGELITFAGLYEDYPREYIYALRM